MKAKERVSLVIKMRVVLSETYRTRGVSEQSEQMSRMICEHSASARAGSRREVNREEDTLGSSPKEEQDKGTSRGKECRHFLSHLHERPIEDVAYLHVDLAL